MFSQPLQWIGFNFFGYKAHKKIVDAFNGTMLLVLKVLGTKITFNNIYKLPENRPLIIVSNHQSFYDIPPLIWFFRKNHPKFISKKELGKGYFGISYNLNHGGSVLIDRKNPRMAVSAIKRFAKRLSKNNWAGIIFPEGTRTKDGSMRKFATTGLEVLFKYAPQAYIVPVTINGSYKLFSKGAFPLQTFVKFSLQVHQPIELKQINSKEIIKDIEETIKKSLHSSE